MPQVDLLREFFRYFHIPLADWIEHLLRALTDSAGPFFRALRWPATQLLNYIETGLMTLPASLLISILFLVAWQTAGLRVALFGIVAMLFIGFIGAWEPTITTMALVGTAVIFSVSLGFTVGIFAAVSDRVYAFMRPVLDVMQTLPAFVYLVPVVMLIGIGNVPAVMVGVIFSLPPMIRLTNLGIREVPHSVVEAAYAFGSTRLQVLLKIQIPMAIPTIMTGINQCIMLALAMSTYSAMIAAGGLGEIVLRGIGRLDMGLAAIGGIGIVLLAMVLDRVTQGIGQGRRHYEDWRNRGPIGLLRQSLRRAGAFGTRSGLGACSSFLY